MDQGQLRTVLSQEPQGAEDSISAVSRTKTETAKETPGPTVRHGGGSVLFQSCFAASESGCPESVSDEI